MCVSVNVRATIRWHCVRQRAAQTDTIPDECTIHVNSLWHAIMAAMNVGSLAKEFVCVLFRGSSVAVYLCS